jgi:transposase-like protein
MGKKKRRSAAVKEQVVLRLLKGEDLELVSRETGFGLHELAAWRERYLRGGREALKSHPGDPANAELDQAKKLIANQALEIEILKKARAIAVSRKP